MVHPLVTTALELAETTLFPAALDVDSMTLVPSSHLEALADAGLYGIETADLAASERWPHRRDPRLRLPGDGICVDPDG